MKLAKSSSIPTKIHWRDWTPWLFEKNTLINDVANSIPSAPNMPFIVRMFESPNSPFYLPAPTTMKLHDMIHVILGRGLLNQDEAFVIGFGMGASLGATQVKKMMFEFISTSLYPKPYKFNENERKILDLGFDLAQKSNIRSIHLENEIHIGEMTIKKAREYFELSDSLLKEWYLMEKKLCKDTIVSKRLP